MNSMIELQESDIVAKLSQYQVPYLDQKLTETSILKSVTIQKNIVDLRLVFGFPVATIAQSMSDDIMDLLADIPSEIEINICISSKILSHAVQLTGKGVPHVKNIIAIGSGKGGVGKSTTTVNLALALARSGARVGILDADIYGPNVPHMLGISAESVKHQGKNFRPIPAHGIQVMSIGNLVEANAPLILRGPMMSSILEELLRDTLWNDLDYLLMDLPPGTGDIQLTLGQNVPVSGAIIVTTPQDVALLDARRGLEMFNKVHICVLGIVENMSEHICFNCGQKDDIFGQHGGQKMAMTCDVPFLGSLPLVRQIRADSDAGIPSVIANPDSLVAKKYQDIALTIAAQLSRRPINYALKIPVVVSTS
jgi:ATP-binding protein involved in chromosome partitioning